jgi:hypothetical protein
MTTPVIKKGPFEWHKQQMELLRKWAEIASCYRWMHNQAYMIYKKKNLYFMIPLIIMSTLTGTANFAQSSFPEVIRPNVPQIIGAINLISAIMTTIYQFLKVSEYMESHRISSINYGKLARNITTELNIPVKDRDSSGADCVKITRNEIDRLIEQSPAIPGNVLTIFGSKFSDKGIEQPEIVVIKKVDIYDDPENKTANTVADAGIRFKELVKKPLFGKTLQKEQVNKELNGVNNSKLVTNPPSPIKRFFNNIFSKPEKEKLNPFEAVVHEIVTKEQVIVAKEPEIIEKEPGPVVKQQDPVANIINEPEDVVVDIINELVESTVQAVGGVQDELEVLKTRGLVSSKK